MISADRVWRKSSFACGSPRSGSMEEFDVTIELRHGCQLVNVAATLTAIRRRRLSTNSNDSHGCQ